jgi:hypothetical protein
MTRGRVIDIDPVAGTILISGDDGKHYRASKSALQGDLTFDSTLKSARVLFKAERHTALDVTRYPRSRPGPVEAHSITGRGIICHVSDTGCFAFCEVPGQRRNVFLHRSQVRGAKLFPGARIRFDHLQPDHLGRPQIIGATIEAE